MVRLDFAAAKDSDFGFEFEATDPDTAQPVVFTGVEIISEIRDPKNGSCLCRSSSRDGSITLSEGGKAKVVFSAEKLSSLDSSRPYRIDIDCLRDSHPPENWMSETLTINGGSDD